jgi:Uma2 family endonuclease
MAVATTDYVDAITHLPAGGVLRVDGVSWGEYEQLLEKLGEGYAVRIFFDHGRMEIMAPAPLHEKPKSIIHTLVTVLRDELDSDVESLGSVTLRAKMRGKGAEPDGCFYVQNALAVIGKEDLDLERQPRRTSSLRSTAQAPRSTSSRSMRSYAFPNSGESQRGLFISF